MEQAATNDQLKSAFRKHLDETKIHVTRLQVIFSLIGAEPESKPCDAILGITDERAESWKSTQAPLLSMQVYWLSRKPSNIMNIEIRHPDVGTRTWL
jgi:hypothetical protein